MTEYKLLRPCSMCDRDWNHPDELIDTLYPIKRDQMGNFTDWQVGCQLHNGGCGRTVYGKSKEEAVARWNQGDIDEVMGW